MQFRTDGVKEQIIWPGLMIFMDIIAPHVAIIDFRDPR